MLNCLDANSTGIHLLFTQTRREFLLDVMYIDLDMFGSFYIINLGRGGIDPLGGLHKRGQYWGLLNSI